jgi:hypothetical protein
MQIQESLVGTMTKSAIRLFRSLSLIVLAIAGVDASQAANRICKHVERTSQVEINICLLTTPGPSAVNGDLRIVVENLTDYRISVDIRCTSEFSEPMTWNRTKIESFGLLFISPLKKDDIIMEAQLNDQRQHQWIRLATNKCTFKVEEGAVKRPSRERQPDCPPGQQMRICRDAGNTLCFECR